MTIRVCRIAQVLFLLAVGLSASSYADGTIYHQVPSEAVALEPLTLEAVVEVEGAAVTSVSIFYRLKGQSVYMEASMSAAGGGLYFGTVPAADVAEAGLEYYLIAVLDDESILAFPVDDPELNPMSIVVTPALEQISDVQEPGEAAAGMGEAAVLILSPEPTEFYLAEDVVVAVSLFNIPDLDASSIRLVLDGQDVTTGADVAPDLVTYIPPELLEGAHQVEVRMNRTSGSAYEPVAWRFLVTEKASLTTERAFQYSGQITPAYDRRDVDGQVLEVSDIKISYRGGWEWLRLRGNVKLTNQEDPFRPPRNRYSASFQTPVLTLGIGDVTPRFDRFGLDGKRLRGYDANLTLGLFNLRVARGELERVIQGRPTAAYTVTDFDSDADSLTVSRSAYTFRRDVLAIRPSIGSGQLFQLAFSFIKAKDNITSVNRIVDDGIVRIDDIDADDIVFNDARWIDDTLHTIYYDDLNRLTGLDVVLPDSNWTGKSPQDNLVLGADLSLALNKRRFVVQSGFALSMLNKNIWDPVFTKDELDTLSFLEDDSLDSKLGGEIDIPFDPKDYENLFHMNLSQVPLVPIDINNLSLEGVSKMPSLAYHATAKLNYLRNFITLQYQQVGPEFNSLANPTLQRNVRIRTISDRVRLFQSKLFITALYRTTDDDIVKVAATDTTKGDPITSTKMVNLSAKLNLGAGLPSLTLGRRTYERNNGIDTPDTTIVLGAGPDGGDVEEISDSRKRTLTKSTNLSLGYRLQLLASTHDLNLNLTSTDISDEWRDERRADDTLFVSPKATSNILSLAARSRFSDRLETSIVLSTNKSEIGEGVDRWDDTAEGDPVLLAPGMIAQDILSIDFTARFRLLGGKLLAHGGFSFEDSKTEDSESSVAPPSFSRFGIKGGASVRLVENLRLVTSFDVRRKQVGSETLPFSIISTNLEYVF